MIGAAAVNSKVILIETLALFLIERPYADSFKFSYTTTLSYQSIKFMQKNGSTYQRPYKFRSTYKRAYEHANKFWSTYKCIYNLGTYTRPHTSACMCAFLSPGPYMPWALYFAPPLHVCAPPLRIPAPPRHVPALRWRPVRALGKLF